MYRIGGLLPYCRFRNLVYMHVSVHAINSTHTIYSMHGLHNTYNSDYRNHTEIKA